MTTILVPSYAMPGRTPPEMLEAARRSLADAKDSATDDTRAACAHLAALRAAAALLAVRAQPVKGARITSVWVCIVVAWPELAEWASYWAAKPTGPATVTSAEQFIEIVGQLFAEVKP